MGSNPPSPREFSVIVDTGGWPDYRSNQVAEPRGRSTTRPAEAVKAAAASSGGPAFPGGTYAYVVWAAAML